MKIRRRVGSGKESYIRSVMGEMSVAVARDRTKGARVAIGGVLGGYDGMVKSLAARRRVEQCQKLITN